MIILINQYIQVTCISELVNKEMSVFYLVQSTLGEMGKPKLIPQFPGSDLASSAFGFSVREADWRQVQAARLSAVVLAAAARALAPEQQADGGIPLPLLR